jgi:hypothetical protein
LALAAVHPLIVWLARRHQVWDARHDLIWSSVALTLIGLAVWVNWAAIAQL